MDEFTNPLEAIRLAIKKEEEAHNFYAKAASITKDPGTRQMFEFLAREEKKHQELLEDKLDKNFLKEM